MVKMDLVEKPLYIPIPNPQTTMCIRKYYTCHVLKLKTGDMSIRITQRAYMLFWVILILMVPSNREI